MLSARVAIAVLAAAVAAPASDGRVVAFHYLWYGVPLVDGKWSHWNHSVLPHWTAAVRAQVSDRALSTPHSLAHRLTQLHTQATRSTRMPPSSRRTISTRPSTHLGDCIRRRMAG